MARFTTIYNGVRFGGPSFDGTTAGEPADHRDGPRETDRTVKRGAGIEAAEMRNGPDSKWAIVTGASSGIGRAIAKQLASEGMNLVLTARRADRLHELADTLPVEVDCIPLDLEEREAPRKLLEFTEGAGIQPSLLVNNAGFGQYGELKDLDPDPPVRHGSGQLCRRSDADPACTCPV